jgi:ribosomal protein L31E
MKNINRLEIPVLSSKLSHESLNSFIWKEGLEQVEAQLPVLSTAVRAAISPKRTESKLSL